MYFLMSTQHVSAISSLMSFFLGGNNDGESYNAGNLEQRYQLSINMSFENHRSGPWSFF